MACFGLHAQNKFMITVDSVPALQTLNPNGIYKVAYVRGYASASAADGFIAYYDSASAAATNTTSVFKPVSYDGRWIRQDITGVGFTDGYLARWTPNSLTNSILYESSGVFVNMVGTSFYMLPTTVYSDPPTGSFIFRGKYNSAGTVTTLAQITMGKENVTDGNNAGSITFYTRSNGGSTNNRLAISSTGVVTISQLTASNFVATDSSKNLVSVAYSTAFDLGSPMTTLGDSIYGGAAGTRTRLGIGSAGQVYTVSGGIPSWQTPVPGLAYNLDNTQFVATLVTNISWLSGAPQTNSLFKGSTSGSWTVGATGILTASGGKQIDTDSGNFIINPAGGMTGFGIAPTAHITITNGSATAGTAPLKLTSGTVLGTPEAGAIEYDGTSLFYTDGTATRRTLSYSSVSIGDWTFGTGTQTGPGAGSLLTVGALTLGSSAGNANLILSPNGTGKIQIKTATGAAGPRKIITDEVATAATNSITLYPDDGTITYAAGISLYGYTHASQAGVTWIGSSSAGAVKFGTGDNAITGTERVRITSTGIIDYYTLQVDGDVKFAKTITAGGTTGARTINKTMGSVNFAGGATTLVVTDSLVTTSSVIMLTVATSDATAAQLSYTPGTGSFTINFGVAPTGETRVDFLVLN